MLKYSLVFEKLNQIYHFPYTKQIKLPGRQKTDQAISIEILRAIYYCEDKGIPIDWIAEILTDKGYRYLKGLLHHIYDFDEEMPMISPNPGNPKWKHHFKDSLERSILNMNRSNPEYKVERDKLRKSILAIPVEQCLGFYPFFIPFI